MPGSKRDSSAAVGLCGSLWVHALLVLVGVELHTSHVERAWDWLRKPAAQEQGGPMLMSQPQQPKPPAPEDETLKRWTRFGDPDGSGIAAHFAEGERPLEARLGPLEQAMLSRDPVGPALRQLVPTDVLLMSGGGASGPRRGTAAPAGGAEAPAKAGESALPFGVSPPVTAPKVLRRTPLRVAGVAPPPTPLEPQPAMEVVQGEGDVPPLPDAAPTTRPTDRLARVLQQSPAGEPAEAMPPEMTRRLLDETGPAQAQVGAGRGPGGDRIADAARPGAKAPAADQAPESESESDASSASGGLRVVAGRVDARFGRRVKVIRPDIGLKGAMDALTSLTDPKVVMRVDVDETGKVTLVTLVRSSGSRELDRPTIQAVYRWWIEPPTDKDGKPRPDSLQLTYGFLD